MQMASEFAVEGKWPNGFPARQAAWNSRSRTWGRDIRKTGTGVLRLMLRTLRVGSDKTGSCRSTALSSHRAAPPERRPESRPLPGGTDDHAVDREAAEAALRITFEGRGSALADRAFLRRVVRHLTAEAAPRQGAAHHAFAGVVAREP
ncbi:SAM-dependent methyltransferase [Spirillospora sp. CA-253888]